MLNSVQLQPDHPDLRLLLITPDYTPIVIDLGATFGISPFKEDLIPETIQTVKSSVKKLTGTSKITKKGFGRWHIVNHLGKIATVEPYLHIVPKSDVQLFCPQDYF